MKRAHWRSWTSSDKDQVTQPHHPNQPHCCWRSRTCFLISPPAQLTSRDTRRNKRHPRADCPDLQECDTDKADHNHQRINCQSQQLYMERFEICCSRKGQQLRRVKLCSPSALQTQPSSGQSSSCSQEKLFPFLLAAPGKQQQVSPSQNTASSSSLDFQRQKDNSSPMFANMQTTNHHRIPEWFCKKGP